MLRWTLFSPPKKICTSEGKTVGTGLSTLITLLKVSLPTFKNGTNRNEEIWDPGHLTPSILSPPPGHGPYSTSKKSLALPSSKSKAEIMNQTTKEKEKEKEFKNCSQHALGDVHSHRHSYYIVIKNPLNYGR